MFFSWLTWIVNKGHNFTQIFTAEQVTKAREGTLKSVLKQKHYVLPPM